MDSRVGNAAPGTFPKTSATAGVDPEQAFVAALSSCHMLWFLALARRKWVVERYVDEAVGILDKTWMSGHVAPTVTFSGTPTEDEQRARITPTRCFIANSVKTEVISSHAEVTSRAASRASR